LLSDLKCEFSPHGRAEEEAVLDLAVLHAKHTLAVAANSDAKDPFMHDIVATKKKSWTAIRKRLREHRG